MADANHPPELDDAATLERASMMTPSSADSVHSNESMASDYLNYDLDGYCNRTVPQIGKTVILRAARSDQVLTLMDDKLTLAPPSLRGNFVWKICECSGWLGFQNSSTGKFLGHRTGENIVCAGDKLGSWEYFSTQPLSDGTFYLVSAHFTMMWGQLCRVGFRNENGERKLVRFFSGGEVQAWEVFEFDK